MSKMIYVVVRGHGYDDDREETIEEAFVSEERANKVVAEIESMQSAYTSACRTFVSHTLDIPHVSKPFARAPSDMLSVKAEYARDVAARAATLAAHDHLEMQRFLEHFVQMSVKGYDQALLIEYANGMEKWGNDNITRMSLLWRGGYYLFDGYLSVAEVPLTE